jgi:NADH-quinone oxidoreductase subunit D
MQRTEWPFNLEVGNTFFVESEEELRGGRRGLTLVVGPQHPGSGHMRLFVVLDGDVIVDVVPDPGFVHRGIEKLAENRPYWTVLPLVEKASIMDSMNIMYPSSWLWRRRSASSRRPAPSTSVL